MLQHGNICKKMENRQDYKNGANVKFMIENCVTKKNYDYKI